MMENADSIVFFLVFLAILIFPPYFIILVPDFPFRADSPSQSSEMIATP